MGKEDTCELRSYPIPMKGPVLLACQKCQRKLKGSGHPLRSLKKVLKAQNGPRVRVLQTACMKMCPKDGITVVTPGQMAHSECSILRNKADVAAVAGQCRREALG